MGLSSYSTVSSVFCTSRNLTSVCTNECGTVSRQVLPFLVSAAAASFTHVERSRTSRQQMHHISSVYRFCQLASDRFTSSFCLCKRRERRIDGGESECISFTKTGNQIGVSQHEGCFFGETSTLDNSVWDHGLYILLIVTAFTYFFSNASYNVTIFLYYLLFFCIDVLMQFSLGGHKESISWGADIRRVHGSILTQNHTSKQRHGLKGRTRTKTSRYL